MHYLIITILLPQLLFLLGTILIIPIAPLLIWQGRRVKKQVPKLPEAMGPTSGTVGAGENPLRLLTLGESTIAGVGVSNHEEGITGQAALELHKLSGRSIEWDVVAHTGYNVQDVRLKLVPQIPARSFDVLVIGLGGNDTFELNRPWWWRKEFKKLIELLQEKQPQATIVITNLPPVGEFPAFPLTIQWVLGSLVRLHAWAINDFPRLFDRLYYQNESIKMNDWLHKLEGTQTPGDFFSDGVHPSALTYRLWGQELAAFIWDKKII